MRIGAVRWGPASALLLAVLVAFVCGPAAAQYPTYRPGAKQEAAAAARALLDERGIPGAQVTILRYDDDRDIFLDLAYGLAQVDSARAVTTETRFRIGSISKLLTAGAAVLLWQEGRLDLDAPVRRYVPEFGISDPGVTPRRLAGHIAGIRHYVAADFMRAPQRFTDVVAAVALFAQDSLRSVPGTTYLYSSFGYNLLGAVVQRAAGQPFDAYLRESLLDPLGLSAIIPERSDSAIPDLAAGYARQQDGTLRAEARTDLSDRWPSGGYLASAGDVAFMGALYHHSSQLNERGHDLLVTPMQTADGRSTGVGFGWRIGTDAKGRVVYHHGGASVGGRAMLVVWRDIPLAVAITTNLSGARITEADAMALGEFAMDYSPLDRR
jgi:CubicO group peptidase (beta-lactamase class C family)